MSYQHSLNMFTRSTNALSYSTRALKAEMTLKPYYDLEHFAIMSFSFFIHLYKGLANLFFALYSIPVALYSLCVDDNSIDAVGLGIASLFIHTLAALTYAANLLVTPVAIVLRALVTICMCGERFYENKDSVEDEIEDVINVSFADEPQNESSVDFYANHDDLDFSFLYR